ncbi:Citryl-CoA lyase [Rubrobacter xylanophilus DSM 9941]|uniref:Citryl-CoA lyase n=1 Tax=Rubrobacter xylanophilus (strain DSM 9941 / JCM 11954 / NBRC 16129 / PRD-1) TaxID=266117 RepID=Q1AS86_RUBXD|nr:CoA ester lyase [Rubrobacter xylanophilus]ABG05742.1 Citryl-CoA lyase [Rubrobacter xylanophilus DSM 9941]
MSGARSLLAVPGSSPRMAQKALASAADEVFLDLEDAVAPGEKAAARAQVVRALRELDWGGRRRLFRMNAPDTPYFHRDLVEVVGGAGGAVDAVLVPKVRRPEDLYAIDLLLSAVEAEAGLEPGGVGLEAQIESAGGLESAPGIARATPRLSALHFGPGDYAASVGMPQRSIGVADEWDEAYGADRFHYAMHRIVVAARAAGLRALDGPVADYRDEEGLRRSSLRARSLGFDGKWCIHPAQIEVVNRVFSPTEEEVGWAKKVVAAYERAEAAGSGAVAVDGQMVDAASIRMAQSTLERARRAGMA